MTIDSLSIDFNSSLSFDLPSVVNLENRNIVVPSIKVKRDKNRNRQCIPSDDEEEEDEIDEEEQEDRPELKKKVFHTVKPTRKSCPLPSDDELSEEEQDERGKEGLKEGDSMQPYTHAYRNQHAINENTLPHLCEEDGDDDKALMTSNRFTFMAGTHLQQLCQKQQYHQAQLAQFQYRQQQHRSSHSHHKSYQQANKNMSGMDLLKQLEQEKAEAKKTRPKLDTSKVKMKGLLGSLPEPGSHNISFQQLEQQQRMSSIDLRGTRNTEHRQRLNQHLDPQQYKNIYPQRSPSPNNPKHRSHHNYL